jgi:superfamily II DNA/RNA helicase
MDNNLLSTSDKKDTNPSLPTPEDIQNVNTLSQINKSDKKHKKGFRAFNLNEALLTSIFKFGYKYPTPIQKKVIPEVLSGFNVIAKSRTGIMFII